VKQILAYMNETSNQFCISLWAICAFLIVVTVQ